MSNSVVIRPGVAFEAISNIAPEQPHPYWTLHRVARVLGCGPSSHAPLAGVSTDTRSLRRGELFVALSGENHDAHAFLNQAKEAGAAALVVSNAEATVGLGLPVFVVPDTLKALGKLARAWRCAWGGAEGGTVIAVAGSNGKTSTKDLLRAALGETFEVHATRGNFNNMIGVPLSLLAIPAHAQIAIIEIGTNAPGEVAALRDLVKPDIAVLTAIGEEHLEGLGDIDGVLKEETSVFSSVALAVLPSRYSDAVEIAKRSATAVITTGLLNADITPLSWSLDAEGCPVLNYQGQSVRIPLRGEHQAENAMLALAVAEALGAPISESLAGLQKVSAASMRGDWQSIGEAVLINDAYNANPPSMIAALSLLDSAGEGRQRVAVLGSMRELGAQSAVKHQDVAKAALTSRADIIVAVGDFVEAFKIVASNDSRVIMAPDLEGVWDALMPRLSPSAIILLKASRGMRFERLVPSIHSWAGA